MQSFHYTPLSVTSRYLAGQFMSLFVPIILGLVMLYTVVDLFDRMNILLRHQATVGAATRYILFKIPLMLTQITPPAVVIAALLTFGLLSRRNEIIALRASGVSLEQTALPITVVTLAISFAALIWNETVVPYSSRKFQYVNNIEIRKRPLRGILSEREIWYHGADGFYNIDYVDGARQTVYGLVIYRLDAGFRLRSVIKVPKAEWLDGRWHVLGAEEHLLENGDFSAIPIRPGGLAIAETLDDFLEVQREPEELSYGALRQRIRDLTRKGIDASNYLVDLYLKLALPFASAVLGLVAIPIGGRLRRHPSMAAIVGLGMALGFGYWVVLGLATSLGESGTLSPFIAAWAANAVYLLLGVALFLYSD